MSVAKEPSCFISKVVVLFVFFKVALPLSYSFNKSLQKQFRLLSNFLEYRHEQKCHTKGQYLKLEYMKLFMTAVFQFYP